LGIPLLKSFFPGQLPMRPTSAVGFLLAGASLALLLKGREPSGGISRRRIGEGLAWAVIALGIVTLLEHLSGWDSGIETTFYYRILRSGGQPFPGPTSWPTALDFVFGGSALLLLETETRRGRRPTDYLSLATIMVGLFGLLGLVLHTTISPTGVALASSALDCVWGCGLLATRPERGIMRLWTSPGLGASAFRRLLPAAIAIPVALAALMRWGLSSRTYNLEQGVMLMVVATVGTLIALVLWTTQALEQSDQERRGATESLHRASAYNRSLIEASLDPLVTINLDGKITDVNGATEKATGRSRDELIGTDFSDYFTEPERARAGYQQVFREGWVQDYGLEIRHRKGQLTPVLYNASLYRDEGGRATGVFAAARDITAVKRAERELQRLNRALSTLSACNQTMVRAQDESGLLREICRTLVEEGGYRLAWVGYAEQDAAQTVRPVAYAGAEDGYLETLRITWTDEPRGRGPTGTALRSGQPVVAKNLREEPSFAPWRQEALQRGYASSIALPLLLKDQPSGVLTVYAPTPDAFDSAETHLLIELADDIAYGIMALRTRADHRRAEEEIRKLNEGLEQRVRERTIELEEANQELQAFTYSVSHDLRAPLRHIDGFSKLFEEEYGVGLPDQARHYVARIRDGTRRMGQMVDDLLSLSRVGRQELRVQMTGLNSLVDEVRRDLEPEIAGRDIAWNVESLPFIECDPDLIKQALANLLSNAVKFTRPCEHAVIEVGTTVQDGAPVIFVRDNGVGFSMKYAGKLFGVFQRLHRQEDFEGTGVGLATVQRIVARHGGRVWAEAELNKGATFYFTLSTSDAKAA